MEQRRFMRLVDKLVRRMRICLTGKIPEEDVVVEKRSDLEMVWTESKFASLPYLSIPDGYEMRIYKSGDEQAYFDLMGHAGFKGWNDREFAKYLKKVLPDGFFILFHLSSGEMAATAMALHNPTELHPFGASLSCVAADPIHQGKGLGFVVSAAVTRRILSCGYKEIYLETEDWRLPAIKTYLKMGWEPFFYQGDMLLRWKGICEGLNWPFTPNKWRKNPLEQPDGSL
jgi:mycothiol synthase